MKKSKVLIPAMALLLFSTAASVTSTVAWFTSTRVYNTQISQFKVAKLDGNLACSMAGHIGTTASNDGQTISVSSTEDTQEYVHVMGDASLNFTAAGPTLWTDNPSNPGHYTLLDTMTGSNGNYSGTEANWLAYTDTTAHQKYYYAVAWKMTFTYTFVAESQGVNIFFDYSSAKSNVTDANATPHASGNDTMKGFRLAFIGAGATRVWSPADNGKANKLSASSTGENSTTSVWTSVDDDPVLVSDTSNTSAVPASSYIDSAVVSAWSARATDGSADQTTRPDYLATIAKPASPGNGTTTVTCVAWFEGTSQNVVDESKMAILTANLCFYAAIAEAPANNG